MYKVYANDELIYDPRNEELLFSGDPVVNLQLNDAGSVEFTIPPTHPAYNDLEPLLSYIDVYNDESLIFTGRISEVSKSYNNSLTFYCEGALAFLNDSLQRQAEYHETLRGYLTAVLDIHNQQVDEKRQIHLGAVTVGDNDEIYRYTNYNSTLTEIKEDIWDNFGGYFRIRKANGTLYLDILEDFGVRCEQAIEFGENLIDYTDNKEFSELTTVLVPIGAKIEDLEDTEIENNENNALNKYVTIEDENGGKDYLVAQEPYSKYHGFTKVKQWNDVHTPQILYRKAKEWLEENRWDNLIINCKAFDLNYTNKEFEAFTLGSEVRIISKPHGLDRWFIVSKQTIHLNNIAQNTIELGGTGRDVGFTSSVGNQLDSVERLQEDRTVIPNKLIEQAINQATQLITSMTHGYVVVEPDQILIMDTEDPETAKNVWRWTMGGLGFSSNGINGPFETAITMDGTIVGKFLAANSVAAEQLDVNYRTLVEQHITQAESDANDYTDGKLKDYWTTKEVETALKTTADSITASVTSTLKGYSTTEQIKAMLSVSEGNIKSYVGDTFKNYSTTSQVQSLIDQKADSITTSVAREYTTKDEFGKLQTTVNSVEQKVTTEGIFTTINNGIAGSERIYNTKFEMTRSGLTIQGGGITIKNNAGTSVFYADTSGNLTMRGDFMHYGNTSYQAIGIQDHEVKVYAWNQSGNYLGSLGAVKDANSSTPYIGLFSDYGDDLVLGSKQSPNGTSVSTIIRLGSSNGTFGIKNIAGTINGPIHLGDTTLTVSNGLITGSNGGSASGSGKTFTYWMANGFLTFSNGLMTNYQQTIGDDGTLFLGDGTFTVSNGFVTSFPVTATSSGTWYIGNGYLTFSHGLLTTGNNSVGGIGVPSWRCGARMTFTNGILTSYSDGYNGINADVKDHIGWIWHYKNGILTCYEHNGHIYYD